MKPRISVVVPLYNEAEVFDKLVKRLTGLAEQGDLHFEFILVDDGSSDATAHLMESVALADDRFKAVFLSRNFGHQIAVTAGMAHAAGADAVMIMDGDLQDPPELVSTFYAYIKEGYDVVYGIREKRKESTCKRFAYWFFYRLLNAISAIDIPLDSGDFCMISGRVNKHILSMPERSRYIRGMRTWVGYRQIGVPYERMARQGGEEKYDFRMLFRLAYDGIFNFSDIPLRLITKLGVFVVLLSVIYIAGVLVIKLAGGDLPQGFLTLIVAISLFSGVQLICLGIIGEYLSRIYNQVKGRPMYIVSRVLENGREAEVKYPEAGKVGQELL